MSVELYQEPIRRRYYASYYSCSYLFFLLSVWILVALPFFLSYDANFWLKSNTYLEQPSLTYNHKTLLSAHGPSTSLSHSSVPAVHALYGDAGRACTIKTRSVDSNTDGVADEFLLTYTLPIKSGESVTKVDAVIFFQAMLKGRAKIVMETPVHISYDSGLPGKGLYTAGVAGFKQMAALPVKGGYTTLYADEPAFGTESATSVHGSTVAGVLSSVAGRNFTTAYEPLHQHWSVGEAEGGDFVIEARIRIPQAEILYVPTATEVLRDAWTKYLAMFLVVGFFLEKLCSFVYFHQIVETKMLVETVGSQVGVPHFKKF